MTIPQLQPQPLDAEALVERLGLQAGMRVAHFGVGGAVAFATDAARRVGEQGEVLVFDVLKTALSAALSTAKQQGLQNCKAVWSNLEIYEGARGIGPGSLDAGMLINVLNQSTKQKDILTEVHRMLKTGAGLLIVDWQPDSSSTIAPDPKQRLAAGHVASMAKSIGFVLHSDFSASQHEWGMIVVKT